MEWYVNKLFPKIAILLHKIWYLHVIAFIVFFVFGSKSAVKHALISFLIYSYIFSIIILSTYYYYSIKNLHKRKGKKYFTWKEYKGLKDKPFFSKCTPKCLIIQSLGPFFLVIGLTLFLMCLYFNLF